MVEMDLYKLSYVEVKSIAKELRSLGNLDLEKIKQESKASLDLYFWLDATNKVYNP